MIFKRLGKLMAAAAILALPMAAHAADTIKVGLTMPTQTLLGKQAVQAAQTAVDLINQDGGVAGGSKIELVPYDDENSPVGGVAAAQRLIDQDGVKFIVGQMSSTVALAILPVAQSAGVIFVPTVPKHTDITKAGYDKLFRLNSTVAMDAAVFNGIIKDTAKAKKIAYVIENTDFGRLLLDSIKKSLEGTDAAVVYEGFYDLQQSDFGNLLTEAKASGADTLVTGGATVEQYANVIRSAAEVGFKPDNIVISPGSLNANVIKLAGASADGTMSSDIYLPSIDAPLNKRFVEAYESKFGMKPEKTEELTFEGVWLLAKAIDKAGSDDIDKVAEALRSNVWETPRGEVRFDETGQAISESFVVEIKDGAIGRR